MNAWLFHRCWYKRSGTAVTALPRRFHGETLNEDLTQVPGLPHISSVLDEPIAQHFDDGGLMAQEILRQCRCRGCLNGDGRIDACVCAGTGNKLMTGWCPAPMRPQASVWGYENRTAAVRIPVGSSKARRIEHRVAGGDVKPYLMLAAISGRGAQAGSGQGPNRCPDIRGNANALDLRRCRPYDKWGDAIKGVSRSKFRHRTHLRNRTDPQLCPDKRQSWHYMGRSFDAGRSGSRSISIVFDATDHCVGPLAVATGASLPSLSQPGDAMKMHPATANAPDRGSGAIFGRLQRHVLPGYWLGNGFDFFCDLHRGLRENFLGQVRKRR